MNTPVPENHCPECGAPLTPGAAQGLCARCLLAGAAAPTEHTAPRSTPPALEQVAAAFPHLEVLELIGHGGMGAVFKVRQPKLARFAALKLLPQSLAADPAFASRFEREAQLLARLNHANIVAVYDHGQAGEFFYLLMEYVDGVNLRQAMRASRFTPEQALGIVPKICEALQYAHDEGVLHRDIKPENILLDAKGRVKLADFGIAKLTAEPDAALPPSDASDPKLTQAGATLGTPQYMAPEQRDTPGDVDHRADIYSLGVVFYELLTGELPIGKFAPPSSISATDPRVDAIVQQALQKERERRQHSASEMKTQVETLGGTAGPRATSTAPAGANVPTEVPGMVTAPAVAMMIVSAMGLLGGLFGGLIITLILTGLMPLLHSTIFPQLPFHIGAFGAAGATLFAVLLLLSGLGVSVFVFVSGLRMLRLRSRGLAMAGSIVLIVTTLFSLMSPGSSSQRSMLQGSTWSLLEIAVGIWALVVLSRPEVKEAFEKVRIHRNANPGGASGTSPADAPAEARRLVAMPATGLMVTSSLNVLLLGAGLLFAVLFVGWRASPTSEVISVNAPGVSFSHTTSPPKAGHDVGIALVPILGLLTLIPSVLTFIGAWRMRQLRGYGLALTAAILGIVTPPGMLLGIIFGIWALIILARSEVRAAFDAGSTRNGGRGCFVAGSVLAGFSVLLVVLLVVVPFVFGQRAYKSALARAKTVVHAEEVHWRVFEADAALVEKLVPKQTRLPGEMQDSQLQTPKTRMEGSPINVASETAEISADVLARLLPDRSAKPGLLVERRREISGWPLIADAWGYNGNGGFSGTISGVGFLGFRARRGDSQFRAEYRVTYSNNMRQLLNAQIAWEGEAPGPGAARAFFLPFTTADGKAGFVVIAFEVSQADGKIVALDKWIQGDWVFDTEYSREKMRFRNPNDASSPVDQAAVKVMLDGYEKMSWTITPTEMQSHHSESGTQAGPYRLVKMLDPNAAEIEISDNGTTKHLVFRREGERLLLSDTDPKPEAIPFELPAYYKRATAPPIR